MANQWIDFAALKSQTGFLPVLAHYGFKVPQNPKTSIKVLCPFHDDEKPSLSVDTTIGGGKFQCFSCKARGNILEFVKRQEDCSLPDAAKMVAEICGVDVPYKNGPVRGQKRPQNDETGSGASNGQSHSQPVADDAPAASEIESDGEEGPINPPLSFTLKLDHTHPYVGERFDKMNLGDESMSRREIVETLGLGVCSRGMMKDRLAIPIHDEYDELIAYAGRWALDEDKIPEGDDKYKLPPGFHKHHVLFNLNRVLARRREPEMEWELDWVVVTEGFFGAIRLHALGVPVVSVMGTSISDDQLRLLDAEMNPSRVILLFDGDEPGKKAAKELVLPMLSQRFFTHNTTSLLDDGEQPDEMTDGRVLSFERLRSLLTR